LISIKIKNYHDKITLAFLSNISSYATAAILFLIIKIPTKGITYPKFPLFVFNYKLYIFLSIQAFDKSFPNFEISPI